MILVLVNESICNNFLSKRGSMYILFTLQYFSGEVFVLVRYLLSTFFTLQAEIL